MDHPIIITARNEIASIDVSQLRDFFLCAGALDDVIDGVEATALNLVADSTTTEGQRQIREMGARLKKISSTLDKYRKTVVEPIKDEPKTIDANVRNARKRLEAIEASVMRPVAEMDARADRLRVFSELPLRLTSAPLAQLVDELQRAKEFDASTETWKELACDAPRIKREVTVAIEGILAKRKKEADDMAELERLREESRKREREAELEKARKEGEERAVKQTASNADTSIDDAYNDLREVIANNGTNDMARSILYAISFGKIRNVKLIGE